MTCAIASPLNSLNDYFDFQWSSASTDSSALRSTLSRVMARNVGDMEVKKASNAKKRASRAGTRSVNTLSAAQLERKRANDREAQRAIRQRTKDHIDHLEKNIMDLRESNETSERLLFLSQQRSRELEGEVKYLRAKLSESGYTLSYPLTDTQQTSPISHGADPSMTMRPSSVTTQHSHPTAASHSPVSRTDSFQPKPYVGNSTSGAVSVADPIQPILTSWRSQDSTPSLPGGGSDLRTTGHEATDVLYTTSHSADRLDWSTGAAAAHAFPMDINQKVPAFNTTASHQQQSHQPYVTSAVPDYIPATAQSHEAEGQVARSFQSPLVASDYRGIPVSETSDFQLNPHSAFSSPTAYSMNALPVTSAAGNYVTATGNMQPSGLAHSPYHVVQSHEQQSYPAHPSQSSHAHAYGITAFSAS